MAKLKLRPVHDLGECITEAQLQAIVDKKTTPDQEEDLTKKGLGSCVFCRRIWMNFWARQKHGD